MPLDDRMVGARVKTISSGRHHINTPTFPNAVSTSLPFVSMSLNELSMKSLALGRRPLPKVSRKRKRVLLLFSQLARQLLTNRPRCERCQIRHSTDPHHLIPRSVAPSLVLEPSNLVALCRVCHNWVGHNPEKAYQTGWLYRSTDWDKNLRKIRGRD